MTTTGSIPPPRADNAQAAHVGISTYATYAAPYGTVQPGTKTDLKFYRYAGKEASIDARISLHGLKTVFAGGRFPPPDFKRFNYEAGYLVIFDPAPKSGGDFGDEEYTSCWRKMHELAHALTREEIDARFGGEGRRMGRLGDTLSLREAKRAVEWEWIAVFRQRELSADVGVVISDDEFNMELNTVMHDAVHRAVTGIFTEPAEEGFRPHASRVPLETALALLDKRAEVLLQRALQSPEAPKPRL